MCCLHACGYESMVFSGVLWILADCSHYAPVRNEHRSPRKRTRSTGGRGDSVVFSVRSLCALYLQHCQSETGRVMEATHHLSFKPDKNGSRDESRHHHRVGVGHSESTPVETALPARMVGVSRASVKKRVAEPGNPTRSERVNAIRVG